MRQSGELFRKILDHFNALDRPMPVTAESALRQEYHCSFEDVVDAVFAYEDIMAALSDDVKPLF